MIDVEVSTQAEFDAALKVGNRAICISGSFYLSCSGSDRPRIVLKAGASLKVEARGSSQPHVEARGSSQPHVEAWESSQPHVEAWESSQPHVVARESSQPHVVAWESSQPHVEAWESSQPHVEAWESSQPHVEAWGSSQPHVVARESSQPHVEAWGYVQLSVFGRVVVEAGKFVSTLIRGTLAKVTGGNQTRIQISTAAEWCEYYGVRVEAGEALLFKAVRDDFSNGRDGKTFYTPGSEPEAPDWDGGKQECGKGLHFSPCPSMALEFHESAKRFVGCWVRLDEIAVHENGNYPEKVKARRVSRPVFECDRQGREIVKQLNSVG